MTRFSKILIANRGEIAARIIRTARRMGISTVAVFSEEEAEALHVRMADQAFLLNGSSLAQTYLDAERIISLAKKSGAEAIHPGYGFLSENELFAEACERAGIIFVGPLSNTIALMGNKTRARESAQKAGLPVIKGYTGKTGELLAAGREMKFPVLIKAAAGGGGKGMRIVKAPEGLGEALEATSREAKAWFGNDQVYIEQYIENPRHIEVQVLGDNHGNIIHLFERECSVQRRYQKIIEESPSPFVTNDMRKAITAAAVKLAGKINYRNAGTIEFLADPDGNFYFLEMNTRIQVEHPVTEEITGIDIVGEQLHVAAGHPLRHKQEDVKISGHAIECRIYAEDPSAGFIPSPGQMTCYAEPRGEGVRVDSAFDNEAMVSGNYDPMISKLISAGTSREEAVARMVDALKNYGIQGVRTNIGFLIGILHSEDFRASRVSTTWCEQNVPGIIAEEEKIKESCQWQVPAIASLLSSLRRKTGKNHVWDRAGYWRQGKTLRFCFEGEIIESEIKSLTDGHFDLAINNERIGGRYYSEGKAIKIEYNGTFHTVFISENNEGQYRITCGGSGYFFRRFDFLKRKEMVSPGEINEAAGPGTIYSPMPGRVIKICRQKGERISKGDVLIIVESMKMENSIKASSDGIIADIVVNEGDMTDGSEPLVIINPLNDNEKNKLSG